MKTTLDQTERQTEPISREDRDRERSTLTLQSLMEATRYAGGSIVEVEQQRISLQAAAEFRRSH